MFILFLIVLGFLLTMTLSPLVPAFIVIGIVTYMFSEYLTHRFLFHIKTPKNPFLLKLIKRLHYDHHKMPNDLKLLFLPIWYSFPNLLLLCLIFYCSFRISYFSHFPLVQDCWLCSSSTNGSITLRIDRLSPKQDLGSGSRKRTFCIIIKTKIIGTGFLLRSSMCCLAR